MKRQWYYRGSLRTCNYSCSYCPFSKGVYSARQIQEDEKAFFRFTDRMVSQKQGGAVLIVPYGEALIYPYYWEGLAALSKSPAIDAVGAQSNFSFPAEQMLFVYKKHGGEIQKLRLWGTFHPEMTSVEQFAEQCRIFTDHHISYCAGAVGVPEQTDKIQKLRRMLPDAVYLWINKMDGMKRRYTKNEISAFSKIDPYFWRELKHCRADVLKCADNCFVEADGSMRRCNFSRQNTGNFYEDFSLGSGGADPEDCKRKECGCYLAYCNRRDGSAPFFWPYPAFRIPVYPKAVFFDVDGTLVLKGETKISSETAEKLIHLAKRCEIYLVTSLPPQSARRKLLPVWNLIRGGIFANGGRRMIFDRTAKTGGRDVILPMEACWLAQAKEKSKAYGFFVHIYRKGRRVYKVTFSFRRGRKCRLEEKERQKFAQDLGISDDCQVLWEDNCMQVIKKEAGKLNGILALCSEMGYGKEETAVFGDSENDREMLEYFPRSFFVS